MNEIMRIDFSILFKLVRLCQRKYRLIEIDLSTGSVLVQVRGKAVFFKLDLLDAVFDLDVINRLSPVESCWLGFAYGRSARKTNPVKKRFRYMALELSSRCGRYAFSFQDFQTGNIGYFNKRTRQSFLEHPLTVLQNEHIIGEFDPSEACYIGQLAGREMEKAIRRGQRVGGSRELESLLSRKPVLRVVE